MSYRLEPGSRNPSIDFKGSVLGPGADMYKYRTRGIYRFDGDRLVLCFALPPSRFLQPRRALGNFLDDEVPSNPRPTAFATMPGDGCVLLIFKRTE
jgi:hypothetical protein